MTETQKILDLCDDCGVCVKNCMFLGYYCDSPKELAKRFKRNPMENLEIPYSCSICGLCERVCPLDLYPGNMCLETRREIINPLENKILPSDFIYYHIAPKLDSFRVHQVLSTSSFFTFNKAAESKNGTVPKTVFFPGCSLPAYSPELVIKSYQYLREVIPGTGIVLNCCGKPCNDMGDTERFQRLFDETVKIFSNLGTEEVILSCINCHKIFREHSDIKIRSLYEVMTEKGFPKNVSGDGQVISIHDSCPARYHPEIRNAVRQIMSQLGFEIAEMQFKNELTRCCGAGGCAPSGNAVLADRHTRKRVGQAKGQLVSYCAHCRERFSTFSPSLHVLDYVFSKPNKRHLKEYHDSLTNWFNRLYLKKRLQFIR